MRVMRNTKYARCLRRNQTDAEKILWHHLRNRQFLGIKFRRQQPIKGYIADFASLERKLVIELDGGSHNGEAAKTKDGYRTDVLSSEGYTVLRFWNNEILTHLDEVLEKIKYLIMDLSHRP